jgi:pre-mRNA-splicing helicase BRR2
MLTLCIYTPHPLLLRPQSHLSRAALNPDMAADARAAVGRATRLLQAMVDVISSSGWLNPALAGALLAGCCCLRVPA